MNQEVRPILVEVEPTMTEPTRWKFLGRDRPGPGCRVVGIQGSANYGGRHGLITGFSKHRSMVLVKWDDEPDCEDDVVGISLLEDEPVLDQMARL